MTTPKILIKAEDGKFYYIPENGLEEFKVDNEYPQHDFAWIDTLLEQGVDVAALLDQEGPVEPHCACYLLNLQGLKTSKWAAAKAQKASQE